MKENDSENIINFIIYNGYNKLCRTCNCLITNDEENPITIYDTQIVITDIFKETTTFWEILQEITHSEFQCDTLPHTLCKNCAQQILNIFIFKKKCLDSEMKLHSTFEMVSKQLNKYQGKTEINLKNNNKDRHKKTESIYECEHCFMKFKTKKKLLQHLHNHSINSRSMQIASLDKKTHERLIDHIKQSPKKLETNYNCDKCYKHFTTQKKLKVHNWRVHIENRFSCEVCGKLFKHRPELTMHMLVHTREKKHQCNICSKYFVTPTSLKYHKRLHTDEKPYKCDICEEMFLSAARRLHHMRRKHYGPQYECEVCAKNFCTPYELKCHTRRHYKINTKLKMIK